MQTMQSEITGSRLKHESFKPLSVTVKECARLTGLGESTCWLYLKQGKLKGVSVGRRRLVMFDSIERLLQGAA
jgi:excisionase family DNA binding protein